MFWEIIDQTYIQNDIEGVKIGRGNQVSWGKHILRHYFEKPLYVNLLILFKSDM